MLMNISFSWIILMLSPLLILMNFNWLLMWTMIEMSTFSFLSIMWTKWFILIHDNRMKYFCIQTLSSILIITFMFIWFNTFLNQWYISIFSLITIIMLLKFGSVPFHSWFITILKNMNFKNLLILSTWQKIIPILLFLLFNMLIYTSLMISVNMIIGVVSQYFSFNFKILLAYSSVSNISWMILAILLNLKTILLFCLFYFIILSESITKMKNMNYKTINFNLNSSQTKWIMISMLSLSGMPPLLGFFPKWFILKNLLSIKWMMILLLMLSFTTFNTLIYLRTSWINMFMKDNYSFNMMNYNKNNIMLLINLSLFMLFLLI